MGNKKILKCGKCKKNITKTSGYAIKCADCKTYHHQTCTELTIEDAQNLSKQKNKQWICESCKDKSSNNSDSSESEGDNTSVIFNSTVTPKYGIEDVIKKLDLVLAEFQVIKNSHAELLQRYKDTEKENKNLREEILILKQQNEIVKIQKHQEELKNNIVITGIPKIPIEQQPVIATKLFKNLNIEIKPSNITKCSQNEKTNIMKITLAREEDKKLVFEAKRTKGLITATADLGFPNEDDNIIYINHDLTIENQKLLKLTRDFKKAHNYKYAWFSNGNVLLRKTTDSKIIHITKEDDLTNLLMKTNY